MTESTHFRLTRDLRDALPDPIWPAGIAVRSLTPIDVPRVYELMNLAYGGRFGDVPTFESWWAETRHDDEYDPTLCLVAVDEDDRQIAFAHVWNSAFIKDFVVHPDLQRRGVGAAMMAEVFATLKARGFESVALKVDAGNDRARRLYARMGFVG